MSKFDQVIENGYDFEMSRYISEGWELFKKGAGSFVGFTVLNFIILFMVGFIIPIPFFSNIIQAVLLGGYFIYCRNLIKNAGEFNDFFGGFKFFAPILLYMLVYFLFLMPLGVLIFTVILPFDLLPELLSGDINSLEYFFEEWVNSLLDNSGSIILLYLLILGLILYLTISYTFTVPLIVDENVKFWDAMEISRKVIGKNFLSFFLLYIVVGIIMIAGTILTCGLGILVATPFLNCVIFSAYDDILSPKRDEMAAQIEDFGQEEKDINTESEDNS